mmetsp:Transcript_89842/g.281251  ORF Transcript_89842/g.281251 Transcript_89842/m.281251 type:complete len:380 (+) Transcript_89842:62-1201(+)
MAAAESAAAGGGGDAGVAGGGWGPVFFLEEANRLVLAHVEAMQAPKELLTQLREALAQAPSEAALGSGLVQRLVRARCDYAAVAAAVPEQLPPVSFRRQSSPPSPACSSTAGACSGCVTNSGAVAGPAEQGNSLLPEEAVLSTARGAINGSTGGSVSRGPWRTIVTRAAQLSGVPEQLPDAPPTAELPEEEPPYVPAAAAFAAATGLVAKVQDAISLRDRPSSPRGRGVQYVSLKELMPTEVLTHRHNAGPRGDRSRLFFALTSRNRGEEHMKPDLFMDTSPTPQASSTCSSTFARCGAVCSGLCRPPFRLSRRAPPEQAAPAHAVANNVMAESTGSRSERRRSSQELALPPLSERRGGRGGRTTRDGSAADRTQARLP